jgi:hypothetical protein
MIRSALLILAALCCSITVAVAQEQHGFTPCLASAGAQTLSVSSSSSNIQLATCGPNVMLFNITAQEAFYNLGSASSTVATTSSFSIPGNSYIILTVPNGATGYYLAAITATSTTTLRVSQGIAQ